MPESQLQYWFSISEFLGFSNPEDIYFPAMLVLDIIVASLAYVLIIKGFHKFRTRKRRHTRDRKITFLLMVTTLYRVKWLPVL